MSPPSDGGAVCVSYSCVSNKGTMDNSNLNDDVIIHFEIPPTIGCACLITLNCMLILIRVFFIVCTLKICCCFLIKHHGNVSVFCARHCN
jgi:hypothetical protein